MIDEINRPNKLFFTINEDSTGFRSRFVYLLIFEEGSGYHGDVDSIVSSADTVRLYCTVRLVTGDKIDTSGGTDHPEDFRLIYTGIYSEDNSTRVRTLVGSIEASGNTPMAKAMALARSGRFVVASFAPWNYTGQAF